MIVLLAIVWVPVAVGALVALTVIQDRLRRDAVPVTAAAAEIVGSQRGPIGWRGAIPARVEPLAAWFAVLGISGCISLALPVLVVVAVLSAYTYSEVLLLAASASAAAWFARLRLRGDPRAIVLPLGGWLAIYMAYAVTMRFFADAVYAGNIGDVTGDTPGFWLDPGFPQIVFAAVLACTGFALVWSWSDARSRRHALPNAMLVASATACGVLAWSMMVFGAVHLAYGVVFAGLAVAHVARANYAVTSRGDVLDASASASAGAGGAPRTWFARLGLRTRRTLAAASVVFVAGAGVAIVPLAVDHGGAAVALKLAIGGLAAAIVFHQFRSGSLALDSRRSSADIGVSAFVAALLLGGFLSLPLAALTGYFDGRASPDAAAGFFVLGGVLLLLSAAGLIGLIVGLRRGDASRWGAVRLALLWPAILVSPGSVARHSLDTGFAAADWVFCAVAVAAVLWVMSRLLLPMSDADVPLREMRTADASEDRLASG